MIISVSVARVARPGKARETETGVTKKAGVSETMIVSFVAERDILLGLAPGVREKWKGRSSTGLLSCGDITFYKSKRRHLKWISILGSIITIMRCGGFFPIYDF